MRQFKLKRKETQLDMLEKKRSVGRPLAMPSGKMKSSEGMAAMRERIRVKIETGAPKNWDLKTCCEAMKNKRFIEYRRVAWVQYGKLLVELEEAELKKSEEDIAIKSQ